MRGKRKVPTAPPGWQSPTVTQCGKMKVFTRQPVVWQISLWGLFSQHVAPVSKPLALKISEFRWDTRVQIYVPGQQSCGTVMRVHTLILWCGREPDRSSHAWPLVSILSQPTLGARFRSKKKIPLGLPEREPLPYRANHESFWLVMKKLCSTPVPGNSLAHVISERRFWQSSISVQKWKKAWIESNLITE